jgi:hypothetical protein
MGMDWGVGRLIIILGKTHPIRLVIPAGIIQIPVFSAPVVFFFTGNMIPVPPYSNFFGTSSGILYVWGLGRMLRRK